MASVEDLDPLDRRRRAAYSVLGLGLLGEALLLVTRYGVTAGTFDALPWFLAPLALAAGATWLARRSWDAVSWLFGTWVCMTGVTLAFLFYHGVLHPDYGMFNELLFVLPALAQVAVVGAAALVALVLHLRDRAPR